LWEYKDVSVLKYPSGVTVENKSTIYVTSFTSNTVVVVEPDGRQGRQLISSDDRLNEPTGIYVDKSKNNLMVTNSDGPVVFYNMC